MSIYLTMCTSTNLVQVGTVHNLEAYYMPIAMMQTLCKTSANSMQRIMSGYSAQASIVQAHCVLRASSIQ